VAFDLAPYRQSLAGRSGLVKAGLVSQVVGMLVESHGPAASVGEICHLAPPGGEDIPAQVVGFRDETLILMPFGPTYRITPGTPVVPSGSVLEVPVGEGLVGRVLDALGHPIDGRGPVEAEDRRPTDAQPPSPLSRPLIKDIFPTGVRAIDALTTIGDGQRIGIFSGAGVGKSVLMGMMARSSGADVSVACLVGERSREIGEFVSRDLGPDGLERTVVIASASDDPPLERIQAALTAMTVAEDLRDRGMRVLLLLDSLTRVATAQREVGLAVGEPPTTRGYPPSAFALLPRILERAGTSPRGSITGFFTVLVEGDDMTEPVADTARGLLDGHIVLSRSLAEAGVLPAIDLGASLSRLMRQLTSEEHLGRAREVRALWSLYEETKDLIRIGAYQRGTNPEVDRAVEALPRIWDFIRQNERERVSFDEAVEALGEVLG